MIVDFIYNHEASIRLSIFLAAFVFLALVEWQWPKRELTQNKNKRWLNNLGLMLTSTLAMRVLVPTAAVGAAYYAEQNHLGYANHVEMDLWLEILLVFILLDLSIYLQHTLFHIMPILWRFHRVHHSDMDCDVSTGVRFHPLEIIISLLIKIAFIMMWGAPVVSVILFEIVLNFMSMFTHSNIRLNKKIEHVLRWFVVTPDMHRIHHSINENETNSNFGFFVSIWDRIFGTYVAEPEAGQLGMTIGITQLRENKWQSFTGLLKTPFLGGIGGYAINYRDVKNAKELAQAKEIAKQHEEKAKLSIELDSYMRAIGQHALVSVTNNKGIIIDVNDKFIETSGYSREELLGKDHRIINSGSHSKVFFEKMWSTIISGEKWHGEVCNRAKNGDLYWVDSAIVPIRGVDGEIESYISVRVDISKRKRYELGIESINMELINANMQLESLSQVDALTNIANRRQLDDILFSYLKTMSRVDGVLTFILCDIDYFKNYNDHYGHQAGDNCLRAVAKSIAQTFTRAGDLVARYGGEEFAVVLPNVSKEVAMMLAERIRVNVEHLALEHKASSVAHLVTVSVGVVTMQLNKHSKVETLIEKADIALYRAKELGRNRTEGST